jgi:hypothetical protein
VTDEERAKALRDNILFSVGGGDAVHPQAMIAADCVQMLAPAEFVAIREEMAEKVSALERELAELTADIALQCEGCENAETEVAASRARVIELEGALRKAIDAAENWPGTSDGQLSEWRRVLRSEPAKEGSHVVEE